MACGVRPQWPSSAFHFQRDVVPSDRYLRSVKDPPLYGISTKDYDRDHRLMGWPTGTEYQNAYCSNYRPILQSCQQQPQEVPGCSAPTQPTRCPWTIPRGGDPVYSLYRTTPLPLVDKFWRGSHNHPNDPLGGIKPDELAKVHCTTFGPEKLTQREQFRQVYTPSYRYLEWVNRPITQIDKDMNCDESLSCRVPEPPTKFFDFYHVVRMQRPAQQVRYQELFQYYRVLPVPINHELPDVPPVDHNPHLGRLNNHSLSEPPYGQIC